MCSHTSSIHHCNKHTINAIFQNIPMYVMRISDLQINFRPFPWKYLLLFILISNKQIKMNVCAHKLSLCYADRPVIIGIEWSYSMYACHRCYFPFRGGWKMFTASVLWIMCWNIRLIKYSPLVCVNVFYLCRLLLNLSNLSDELNYIVISWLADYFVYLS